MKKFFKYSLYGLIYLIIILFMAVMFIVTTAKADLIKPNIGIDPNQVVLIQLNGLKKNNVPDTDHGIKQTWEFAHPTNKIFTGPLDRFKEMIKGESYKMLLNHKDHKINQVFSDENKVIRYLRRVIMLLLFENVCHHDYNNEKKCLDYMYCSEVTHFTFSVHGGTVIDPSTGTEGVHDIVVHDGKIEKITNLIN